MLRLLLSLGALFLTGSALAQQYAFRHYGQADGLGNLAVTALAQGLDGYVWVGTENGLYRFDADHFTRIRPPPSRSAPAVNALHVDGRGRVWMGSNDGLFLVDGDRLRAASAGPVQAIWHGQFIASSPADPDRLYVVSKERLFLLARRDPLSTWDMRPAFDSTALAARPELAKIQSVAVAGDGTVWLGCGDAICRWKGPTIERWGEPQHLPRGRWAGLVVRSGGSVWARSDHDMIELSPESGHVDSRLPPGADRGSVHKPLPIANDRSGRILSYSDDGIFRGTGAHWEFVGLPQGLDTGGAVNALLADRDGNLWIGSAGRGLVQWLGYGQAANWTRREGLPSDDVWTFLRDREGRLHVGTGRGQTTIGAHALPAPTNVPEIDDHQIGALAEDRAGALWLGTFSGALLKVDPRTGRARVVVRLPLIFRLLVDRTGRLWICTERGIYVIDRPEEADAQARFVEEAAGLTRTRTPQTFWACESTDGSLWFSAAEGLIRHAGDTWELAPMRHRADPGRIAQGVSTIACAADGSVWLGELDSGRLWHLEHKAGSPWDLSDLTPPEMRERHLGALLVDRRGWLWLATDNGVALWNRHQWRFLTQEDGLVWNDANQNALYEDTDGSIWIGTSGGASHLSDPEALFGQPVRPVLFEHLRYDGKELAPAPDMIFPWSHGSLDLVLADPVFRHSGDRALLSRLDGLEDAWTSHRELELHFASLPPGRYRLEVQVTHADLQTHSPITTLAFVVEAPWWRTGPFLALLASIVVAGLVGIVQRRTRRLARRQVELESIVAERTRELEDSHEAMRMLALKDGLTQAWNRRAVLEALDRELSRCGRDGRPLTVVMIDADHFKRINDEHGHPAGDAVLCEIVSRLDRLTRNYDMLGRYGGEEFLLVLPELSSGHEEGRSRIESFQRAVGEAPIQIEGSSPLKVTCSFGVATCDAATFATASALIARADAALYAAKAGGRNRVAYG